MRALVVYESLFGNTAEVAAAVGDGIRAARPDATVHCTPTQAAADLGDCDLLVVGAPTHFLGMSGTRSRAVRRHFEPNPSAGSASARAGSEGVREWLDALAKAGASGRAATFDTRLEKLLAGGAAKKIARRLRRKGYAIIATPEGFVVGDMSGPLLDGELDRARAWGAALARLVPRARPAANSVDSSR